jgi:hypothetical protein
VRVLRRRFAAERGGEKPRRTRARRYIPGPLRGCGGNTLFERLQLVEMHQRHTYTDLPLTFAPAPGAHGFASTSMARCINVCDRWAVVDRWIGKGR